MVMFTMRSNGRAHTDQCQELKKPGLETVPGERKVGIPLVTLTAEDCDPSRSRPPPRVALSDRVVEFEAPEGSTPGCTLTVPIDQGEEVRVALPGDVGVGDAVHMRQRADGSWRVSKKATEFSFVMSNGVPGGLMKLHNGPGGFPMVFKVPQYAEAGDIINLELADGTEWGFKGTRRVGTPVEELPLYDRHFEQGLAGCYRGILDLVHARVRSQGRFTMSSRGVVRVNVPLCGRFSEYAVLGDFVARRLLTVPGVSGARIVATEANNDFILDWAMASRWFSKAQPRIEFDSHAMDFLQDSLPKADITIALHPEVTKGGSWFPTIGSIVRSRSSGGLVVFATFYRAEAETLLNMVHMYKDDGAAAEIVENPWYADNEAPLYPPMRYLVVVSSAPN